MAVQPQTPYKEYTANGSTNSFALEFDCDNQDHLIVLVDGMEPVVGTWLLSGGAVVFGTTPASGKKITIQRNTPFRRDEDFQSYDNSFRPPGVNNGFDKIWLKLQELGVADWILSNRINDLRAYIDKQDNVLQDNIDSLKNYVDDKDDELRNYLLNAIQEQGVALDQLEEYYSYLMQQLAQVTIDRGWAASFIVSADGSTQQEINDFGGAKWWNKPLGYDVGSTVKLESGDTVKSTDPANTVNPNIDMTGWVKIGNLIIVNTVAEMLVKNLKNGDVVKTLGYNNLFDNGGALYVISNTAIDYSIPLTNGKHALFNDTFDIRKFGIQNNKDLDQDIELQRLAAYADKYCYEVDFKNFAIRVPATTQFTTGRGTTVRGLGFNKVHDIKNLHLVANKSITQAAGLCPLGFYPKSKPDCSGLFKLTNFTCDPQLTDFLMNSGEFDGMFVGFLAEPHPDWGYLMWKVENVEVMPIEFEINNIDFKTPAMTYNMSIAGWKSKRISINSLKGDYIGLYAHVFADKLFVDDVDVTYRKDLHASDPFNRELVTSAIHQEPELGQTGSASISLIDVKNVKVRDTDGNIGLGFWNWSQGKLTIDTVNFENMDSYCNFSRSYSYRGSILNLNADNVAGLAIVFDVINLHVKNSPIKKFQTFNLRPNVLLDQYLLNASAVTKLTLTDCKTEKICTDYNAATVVQALVFKGGEVSSNDYILALLAQVQLNVKDLDALSSTKFIRAGLANAVIDGLKSSAVSLSNFMFDELSEGSPIRLRNLDFVASSGVLINGSNAINISNSSINIDISEVFLRKSALKLNTTYSKPLVFNAASLNAPTGSTATKDFVVPTAKVGDVFLISATQNLQGCTVSSTVAGDSTLRIYISNNTSENISLSDIEFLVEPIILR